MDITYIILAFLGIFTVLLLIFRKPGCKHENQIFFDASGDELPGYDSEACFCKCLDCGQVSVIPSNFQSDAHFDNYLHQCEMGGSQAVRKIHAKPLNDSFRNEE